MDFVLSINNLTCLDREMRALFSGLSLRLAPGQHCALSAADPQAVTACVRVAASLQPANAGSLAWFNGTPQGPHDLDRMAAVPLLELRRRIGFVARATPLISNLTLWDNLTLATRYHRKMGKQEAMEQIAPMVSRLGLEAFMDQRPAEVGISWQRLAVYARELATEPELLIMEMPELDLAHDDWAAIMSEIKRLPNCTVLMGSAAAAPDAGWFDLVAELSPQGCRVRPAGGS